MLLELRPQSLGNPIELELNRSFAEAIQIEQILPQPLSVATSDDRYLFVFSAAPSDSSASVVIRYRPESLGSLLVVARAGGSEVRFRQFVYP
jgi:hypothetical protein